MAWSFRKSLNFGPLRINLSKKGFGFSVGGRGFRAGRDVHGRGYTQSSIPGTGIYNKKYLPPAPKVGTSSRVSPSTKYLALLMGIGFLVWFVMHFFVL